MTVAKYIAALRKLPQDAKCVVWGCMGKYEPKPYLDKDEKKCVVLG